MYKNICFLFLFCLLSSSSFAQKEGVNIGDKAIELSYKNPNEKEIRDWLEGNICRCTGYQGIVAAVKDAASKV